MASSGDDAVSTSDRRRLQSGAITGLMSSPLFSGGKGCCRAACAIRSSLGPARRGRRHRRGPRGHGTRPGLGRPAGGAAIGLVIVPRISRLLSEALHILEGMPPGVDLATLKGEIEAMPAVRHA